MKVLLLLLIILIGYTDTDLLAQDSTLVTVKTGERIEDCVLADIRKMGTHNRSTTSVAITSLSYFSNGQDAAKGKALIMNEELVLRKETQYYFGDKYNHFIRASKKRLLNLFPKEEQRIENYLKENKVNFDKKDDLEKRCQFLLQLI